MACEFAPNSWLCCVGDHTRHICSCSLLSRSSRRLTCWSAERYSVRFPVSTPTATLLFLLPGVILPAERVGLCQVGRGGRPGNSAPPPRAPGLGREAWRAFQPRPRNLKTTLGRSPLPLCPLPLLRGQPQLPWGSRERSGRWLAAARRGLCPPLLLQEKEAPGTWAAFWGPGSTFLCGGHGAPWGPGQRALHSLPGPADSADGGRGAALLLLGRFKPLVCA